LALPDIIREELYSLERYLMLFIYK
jgi:hypothetical protein